MSRDGKPSKIERIKESSAGLRGTLAEELASDISHLSGEAIQVVKFHGIYQQDDRDVRRDRKRAGQEPAYSLMVRSKIPGGVLTAEQYLVHDELAGTYGNGTVRVTTRQDIQLHGVVKADARATIRALNERLVTTLGACGDLNRNVMSCPAPVRGGLREEALSAARRVSDHLLPRTRAYHEIWLNGERVTDAPEPEGEPVYGQGYLPRKFKTAIAFPDDNCTDVLSNDLGLLAIPAGDRIDGFNVSVGGGLGQTHGKEDTYPRLADPLGFATPEDVVEIAEAVVKVQRDHGNRSNRKRARLKYLIDERGLGWFRGEVEARLGRRLEAARPVQVARIHDHLGWHEQGDGRLYYGLFIENGRIQDLDDQRLRAAIRTVAERLRPGVHLTPQQNLLFTGVPEGRQRELELILDDHGVPALSELGTARRWSMACPALPTCGLAIAEAERALPGLLDELEPALRGLGLEDEPLTIRMTGCPNGCARPYTADLAFVGRSLDKYTVFVGGNMLGNRLGFELADLVPRDQLVPTAVALFERFKDERRTGERFGDYCARVGPEALERSVSTIS